MNWSLPSWSTNAETYGVCIWNQKIDRYIDRTPGTERQCLQEPLLQDYCKFLSASTNFRIQLRYSRFISRSSDFSRLGCLKFYVTVSSFHGKHPGSFVLTPLCKSFAGNANGDCAAFHTPEHSGISGRCSAAGISRIWHPASSPGSSCLSFTVVEVHGKLCYAPNTFKLLLLHEAISCAQVSL